MVISNATGLFTPSFRDASSNTFDTNFTTYYGWTGNIDPGSSADDFGFDNATDPFGKIDDRVVNVPVQRGAGGIDGTLNQTDLTQTILSSSNNIFVGNAANQSFTAYLTLEVATNGAPGPDGFTTVIIQGIGSITGTELQLPAQPGVITLQSGLVISPEFLSGRNASSRLQWWARYEIPGNQPIYSVSIEFLGGPGINPGSLREISVDTIYSLSGYAREDLVVVPEPGVSLNLICAVGTLGITRFRRKL